MDTTILQAIGAGGATAIGFQFLKGGDWNRWLTVILAMVAAFGTGFVTGGSVDSGVQSSIGALAVHSALLQSTSIGSALQQHGLPRILRLVADLAKALAEAIEPKKEGGS